MTFTVSPLGYKPSWAVQRTLRQVNPDGHVDFDSFYQRIVAGQDFILGGPRGCGKTSLLNEVRNNINASPGEMLVIGPLSWWLAVQESALPIQRTVARQNARSILLLLDDLNSAPPTARESILNDARALQAETGLQISLGCAGDLHEDEMGYNNLANGRRYLLAPFTSRELDELFANIQSTYGIRFVRSAQREVRSRTSSIPYFVQALMLSLFSGEHYHGTEVTTEMIKAASEEMPSSLVSNFAQPLTILTDRARDDAQELLNQISKEGSTAVDWNYSLVRDLKRWGLVQRDALDWMTWTTPLLGQWFEQAGPGFKRIDDLRWNLDDVSTIETKAAEVLDRSPINRAQEPTNDLLQTDATILFLKKRTTEELVKSLTWGRGSGGEEEPDTDAMIISRETAIELYSALVTNLGSVGPLKGSGKGAGAFELPGRTDIPPPPSRGDDYPESQPRTQQKSRAKRSTTETPSSAGLSRYINLWFTEKPSDELPIDKSFALEHNGEVYLRMNIGPLDERTIMDIETAVEFVREETLASVFPETAGKPVPLEATIFSRDFEIAERSHTKKFELVPNKASDPIYFPLIPHRKQHARLRLCVFYKNHLLQSLNVTAAVKKRSGKGRTPQTAVVELTFSADFGNVPSLPARALWLGINQSADDTHSLNLKTSDKALRRDLQNKIETALRRARKALLDVSFTVTTENGKQKKVYRFNSQNFPDADSQKYRDRFRDDLTKLAVAGSGLYQAIFGFVPTVEQRESVWPIVEELKVTLRKEETIQIARLKRMDDIWPWAMVYDSPVDPKRVKDVCLSYRGKDGPLPYSQGVQNCTHAADDETIVCPYSFWGFKHIIEQPTQPGGKKAFNSQNLALEIKIGAAPVYRMLLNNELGQLEANHVNNMKTMHFTTLASLADITAALNPSSKPPPVEPHLMYFFCHGKSDDEQGPYLSVGSDEALLPSKLDAWDFRWPNSHALVFINGCHTVDLDPAELSSIMQPFVEAGASGIIGTEISVTTGLAREFAQEFFKRLLSNNPNAQEKQVGQIIKDLRLNLLMKYNPLGLVYTPYCSADLHVTV